MCRNPVEPDCKQNAMKSKVFARVDTRGTSSTASEECSGPGNVVHVGTAPSSHLPNRAKWIGRFAVVSLRVRVGRQKETSSSFCEEGEWRIATCASSYAN
jgi:hypothetical protein